MAIQRVEIENFTAFAKAELDFSPGLNVFIGPNGTGKTHLLKLLYVCLRSGDVALSQKEMDAAFLPDDQDVARLVRRGNGEATIKIFDSSGANELVGVSGPTPTKPNQHGSQFHTRDGWPPPGRSLFFPSREALAMYESFIPSYELRELSFDVTYYDCCVALNAARLREIPQDWSGTLGALRAVLGGKVVLKGNRFYVERNDGPMEAHLLSEGLRKLAMIYRLIENGSIAKENPLLWDEPEANLNPRLQHEVIDFLRTFAQLGGQAFLASHDYLLTRRLSLLAQAEAVPIRFFAFRIGDDGAVAVESGPDLRSIDHDPLLDEHSAYYDEQHEAAAREEK